MRLLNIFIWGICMACLMNCQSKEGDVLTPNAQSSDVLLKFSVGEFHSSYSDTAKLIITTLDGEILVSQEYEEFFEFEFKKPDGFVGEKIIVHDFYSWSYNPDYKSKRVATYRDLPVGSSIKLNRMSTYNYDSINSLTLKFINVPENDYVRVDGLLINEKVDHLADNEEVVLKGVNPNNPLSIISVHQGDSLFYLTKVPTEGETMIIDMAEGAPYTQMEYTPNVTLSGRQFFTFNILVENEDQKTVSTAYRFFDEDEPMPSTFKVSYPDDDALNYKMVCSYQEPLEEGHISYRNTIRNVLPSFDPLQVNYQVHSDQYQNFQLESGGDDYLYAFQNWRGFGYGITSWGVFSPQTSDITYNLEEYSDIIGEELNAMELKKIQYNYVKDGNYSEYFGKENSTEYERKEFEILTDSWYPED